MDIIDNYNTIINDKFGTYIPNLSFISSSTLPIKLWWLLTQKPKPTRLFQPLTQISFPRSLLNLFQKLILETDVIHRAFCAVKIWFLFLET